MKRTKDLPTFSTTHLAAFISRKYRDRRITLKEVGAYTGLGYSTCQQALGEQSVCTLDTLLRLSVAYDIEYPDDETFTEIVNGLKEAVLEHLTPKVTVYDIITDIAALPHNRIDSEYLWDEQVNKLKNMFISAIEKIDLRETKTCKIHADCYLKTGAESYIVMSLSFVKGGETATLSANSRDYIFKIKEAKKCLIFPKSLRAYISSLSFTSYPE